MKDEFFEINQSPTDWIRVEIGNLFDTLGGFSAPQNAEAFIDGIIPFVRMQDLGRYHRTTNLLMTKDKLNAEYVKKNKLRIIPKGSILIPRSGSVSLNHRAILGVDACVVSHICALVPKVTNIDIRFLYYSLCNFDMRKIMKKTTGLDAITFQDVNRILLPVPNLSIQNSIANILQKADTLNQKRQESNMLANKLTQAIFFKMFGEPNSNPMGWQKVKLVMS